MFHIILRTLSSSFLISLTAIQYVHVDEVRKGQGWAHSPKGR